MQNSKKFSTIDYSVLNELDVTPNEMAYIDMVYYLSKAGNEWCYKSLQAIANDLNLGKSTVKSMRDRLITRVIFIRNDAGYVKTTAVVHESYGVRYSHDEDTGRAKSARFRAKSEHNRAKSAPKNNNRYTENKGIPLSYYKTPDELGLTATRR